LKEIVSRPELGSADAFERCHEESCLFHLIGAKDAFLHEINNAYELGLPVKDVRESKLEKALKRKDRESPELNTLKKLQSEKTSWLAIANELRHHGTHRTNISRKLYLGGERNGEVVFENPLTATEMSKTIPHFIKECLDNMTNLVQALRAALPKAGE